MASGSARKGPAREFPLEEDGLESVGELFDESPRQWGLRGCPYLWADMARVFAPVPLPDSADRLQGMIEAAFFALTARPVTIPDPFLVARYAGGGMSSGGINPRWWREKAIPLLVSRYLERKST